MNRLLLSCLQKCCFVNFGFGVLGVFWGFSPAVSPQLMCPPGSMITFHCTDVSFSVFIIIISIYFLSCFMYYFSIGGPCCVVAKTAGYELDGPGSNPSVGEIFCTFPDRPWSPPSLLYNGYRVFPGGKNSRGVTLTPHLLLVPLVMKE
jgi:hypothetical protein